MSFGIKGFFEKLRNRVRQEHCYANMEYFGIAIFGCCRGGDGSLCKSCRYWTPIDKEETDEK